MLGFPIFYCEEHEANDVPTLWLLLYHKDP